MRTTLVGTETIGLKAEVRVILEMCRCSWVSSGRKHWETFVTFNGNKEIVT